MACNCNKPITLTECQRLRKYNDDIEKRFFIYYISDSKGLVIAHVPKGESPNKIALERGFFNDKGQLEWFNIKEHNCVNNE